MKPLGWVQGVPDATNAVVLWEVLIEAEPDSLRELARFITHAADEMERMGASYDHIHFQDESDAWRETWPEVVILRERT